MEEFAEDRAAPAPISCLYAGCIQLRDGRMLQQQQQQQQQQQPRARNATVTKKLKIKLKDNAKKLEKMNKNISYYKDHNS